ncbi:MAG: hypothetical protein JJD92_12885 [Frankiaceae bacterium]|nr:hypothetical protein [Frankiaceae bacterium]
MSDDDLTPFRDDPLLVALRAPAEPHELADEDSALAMFRQSLPARTRRRRAITRATVGGAGILLGLGLTAGVAAAYTTGLPDPVQDVVHAALDPLPVPAPPSADHRARKQALRQLVLPASPRATAPGSSTTTPRTAAGTPAPGRQPEATRSPIPSTAPRPAAAPSPTPAPPKATLTAAVSRRVVPVHTQVVLSGRLSRGAEGVPNRRVYAAELVIGDTTWRRVATGLTGGDGTVSLTIPALTSNVRLRLVTEQGITSPELPVSVVPTLSLTMTRSGNELVVTVTADGGRPGDALNLLRRDGEAWTSIGSTTLSNERSGVFSVPGPGAARMRYVVRLPATRVHAASFKEFVVPAR